MFTCPLTVSHACRWHSLPLATKVFPRHRTTYILPSVLNSSRSSKSTANWPNSRRLSRFITHTPHYSSKIKIRGWFSCWKPRFNFQTHRASMISPCNDCCTFNYPIFSVRYYALKKSIRVLKLCHFKPNILSSSGAFTIINKQKNSFKLHLLFRCVTILLLLLLLVNFLFLPQFYQSVFCFMFCFTFPVSFFSLRKSW